MHNKPVLCMKKMYPSLKKGWTEPSNTHTMTKHLYACPNRNMTHFVSLHIVMQPSLATRTYPHNWDVRYFSPIWPTKLYKAQRCHIIGVWLNVPCCQLISSYFLTCSIMRFLFISNWNLCGNIRCQHTSWLTPRAFSVSYPKESLPMDRELC